MPMVQFKGFKTLEEAKAFQKKNGGMLTWKKLTPKRKQKTLIAQYYEMAVNLGGLDEKTYPYCVQWNI